LAPGSNDMFAFLILKVWHRRPCSLRARDQSHHRGLGGIRGITLFILFSESPEQVVARLLGGNIAIVITLAKMGKRVKETRTIPETTTPTETTAIRRDRLTPYFLGGRNERADDQRPQCPPLRPVSISTVTRPDIGERMRDYRFVKAGFKLNVSAVDTRPVQTKDVVIIASSTVAPRLADRDVRLPCCGYP